MRNYKPLKLSTCCSTLCKESWTNSQKKRKTSKSEWLFITFYKKTSVLSHFVWVQRQHYQQTDTFLSASHSHAKRRIHTCHLHGPWVHTVAGIELRLCQSTKSSNGLFKLAPSSSLSCSLIASPQTKHVYRDRLYSAPQCHIMFETYSYAFQWQKWLKGTVHPKNNNSQPHTVPNLNHFLKMFWKMFLSTQWKLLSLMLSCTPLKKKKKKC